MPMCQSFLVLMKKMILNVKKFLLMFEKFIDLNLLKPTGRLRNESFGFFYDKITLIQKLILLLVCLIPNLETSCGLGPHL